MPRSATDATRFTSTTPHVSAKPSSARNLPVNNAPARKPGPPGETPQEKVKRLRAAADRARDAQVSTFDKVIVRGRVWADRLHRFTALSLIGATVIAGGVTVYALGDMMVYNRRKRAQFFEEQKALHRNAIHTARAAIGSGTATEEQIKFIAREEEHEAHLAAVAKEKAETKGIFGRGREWLFSGLKKGEEGGEVQASERSLESGGEGSGMREGEMDIVRPFENRQEGIKDKAKLAFADEKERQRTGGPLDRLGTTTVGADEPKSRGWTSFMTRR